MPSISGPKKIVVGGDLVPGGRVLPDMEIGEAVRVLGGAFELFNNSDFSIVNLECPIVDSNSPIRKSGPHLRAPVKSLNALGSIDAFNLANNHILDHGEKGVISTLLACENCGIQTVGLGENLDRAADPLVRDLGGVRLGVIAMAEHEFSIAKRDGYGANPIDLRRFVRSVKANKHRWDFLVVLIHGGIEHYPYPTPELQDTCRFLVEQGANAVVVQHTHCAGCWETYQGGHIVYGQGNLLFDRQDSRSSAWNEGFLVELQVAQDGSSSKMTLHPYTQCNDHAGIQILRGEDSSYFLEQVNRRSSQIADPDFVIDNYRAHIRRHAGRYLGLLYRRGPWWRRAYRLLGERFLSKSTGRELALLNMLRCEALREAGISILSQQCGESE